MLGLLLLLPPLLQLPLLPLQPGQPLLLRPARRLPGPLRPGLQHGAGGLQGRHQGLVVVLALALALAGSVRMVESLAGLLAV